MDTNDDFISCWNEILVPKWNRFRHLLSGNGAIHSNLAYPYFDFKPGNKVLDIGCGYGETCLEIGKMVTDRGEVIGLDCTESFLQTAEQEKTRAGVTNVKFELGDAQTHPLSQDYFDIVFSRFGVMFFQSVVMAMRNAYGALKNNGKLCMIVWRTINDNPCWGAAKEIALRHLPPPGDSAKTCGPGPFSMADEETTRAMIKAAGFNQVDLFKKIDADICIGTSVAEAIDYQILVGPSGEIIREAGDLGQDKLPIIRRELETLMTNNLRKDGIYMPSSTWAIMARKS